MLILKLAGSRSGLLLARMSSATWAFKMSPFLPICHGYKPIMVLKNKRLIKHFS